MGYSTCPLQHVGVWTLALLTYCYTRLLIWVYLPCLQAQPRRGSWAAAPAPAGEQKPVRVLPRAAAVHAAKHPPQHLMQPRTMSSHKALVAALQATVPSEPRVSVVHPWQQQQQQQCLGMRTRRRLPPSAGVQQAEADAVEQRRA
jgi:hypothetical protein